MQLRNSQVPLEKQIQRKTERVPNLQVGIFEVQELFSEKPGENLGQEFEVEHPKERLIYSN